MITERSRRRMDRYSHSATGDTPTTMVRTPAITNRSPLSATARDRGKTVANSAGHNCQSGTDGSRFWVLTEDMEPTDDDPSTPGDNSLPIHMDQTLNRPVSTRTEARSTSRSTYKKKDVQPKPPHPSQFPLWTWRLTSAQWICTLTMISRGFE